MGEVDGFCNHGTRTWFTVTPVEKDYLYGTPFELELITQAERSVLWPKFSVVPHRSQTGWLRYDNTQSPGIAQANVTFEPSCSSWGHRATSWGVGSPEPRTCGQGRACSSLTDMFIYTSGNIEALY